MMIKVITFEPWVEVIFFCFDHSHKKWQDLAVLRTYVENQAKLEPILLYCASKYKPMKRTSRTAYGPIFLPFL